jgi:hypothetical protein
MKKRQFWHFYYRYHGSHLTVLDHSQPPVVERVAIVTRIDRLRASSRHGRKTGRSMIGRFAFLAANRPIAACPQMLVFGLQQSVRD